MSSEGESPASSAEEEAPRSRADQGVAAMASATATTSSSPVRSPTHPAVRYDDFRCPICLDLLYKPSAPMAEFCSHVFCFFCLHSAMSPIADSRCPLDRGTFSHQPAVAIALHRALSRLFPLEYARRAEESREEEEATMARSQAVVEEEGGETGGEEGGGAGGGEAGRRAEGQAERRPPPALTPADFSCSRPGCGKLLLSPVVLNCGHAVCGGSGSGVDPSPSSCVPTGRACPSCGGAGRVGPSRPRTCSLLAGLVETLFPEEVAARRMEAEEEEDARRGAADAADAAAAADAAEAAAPLDQATQEQRQRQQQRRSSVVDCHFGIGCDACGSYPIRGRRYRCEDCAAATAVGFDLCGACYDAGVGAGAAADGAIGGGGGVVGVGAGDVGGRFAQGHLPSHRVVEVPLRPGFLHRIAEAHPELSIEQVLRLTQLALGRDDDENGDGGREEEEGEVEDDEAAAADDAGGERASATNDGGVERARARARGRRSSTAAGAREGDGTTTRPPLPPPIATRTTIGGEGEGPPTATIELEFDPARLPRDFPFSTVGELEEFFNGVERHGPGGLPEEARETMARFFPELLRFMTEHGGGGDGGEGGEGDGGEGGEGDGGEGGEGDGGEGGEEGEGDGDDGGGGERQATEQH